jgi:general secretion pathway protein I
MRARPLEGFTLIEVLVALAIIAIAISASLYTVNGNIRQLDYLQRRSLAHLAALNTIEETLAGAIKPPLEPYTDERKTELLRKTFYISVYVEKAQPEGVERIVVKVRNEEQGPVLVTLISYRETT